MTVNADLGFTLEERAGIWVVVGDAPGEDWAVPATRRELALWAALEAAVQTPKPGTPGVHWECDCVPEIGPTHCHECGEIAGRIIEWSATTHAPSVVTGKTEDAAPPVDPNVCPECGNHMLTGDRYAMSHDKWVEFLEWHAGQSFGKTEDAK